VPHTNARLRERLRLLYSWREQARRLARGDKSRRALRTYYAALAREAEYYIRQTRDDEQAYLEELGRRLRDMLGQTETLVGRQQAGRISEADTLLVKRELDGRVERLRNEIGELNELLRASNSEGLGGFVDLGIEEYAQRLGIVPEAKPKPGINWTRLSVIAAIVAVAVCAITYYATSLGLPSGLVATINAGAAPDTKLYVVIRNEGPYAWRLHALAQPEEDSASSFAQMLLFVRDAPTEPYRPLPALADAWQYENRPIEGRPPVSVPPTIQANFTVDALRLNPRGGRQSYRIEGRDENGLLVFEAETAPR
jgi:hypothetical protein